MSWVQIFLIHVFFFKIKIWKFYSWKYFDYDNVLSTLLSTGVPCLLHVYWQKSIVFELCKYSKSLHRPTPQLHLISDYITIFFIKKIPNLIQWLVKDKFLQLVFHRTSWLNAEPVTRILMIRTSAFYTYTFDISGKMHFHSELHRLYFFFSQRIP